MDKLAQYDVAGSLDSMMRAAQAKQDKEHMKMCMDELQKRKKQLATLMKDLGMKKSQEVKRQVANKLAKAFESKDIDGERAKLIAIDVLLKAAQLTAESQQVVEAAGTEVIQEPTPAKEVKFAGNLFQDYKVGSTISNTPQGSVLANAKKPTQDYVQNSNKTKNQAYTAEQLKTELANKKA